MADKRDEAAEGVEPSFGISTWLWLLEANPQAGLQWTDPDGGRWLVRFEFDVRREVPTCVGMEITSRVPDEEHYAIQRVHEWLALDERPLSSTVLAKLPFGALKRRAQSDLADALEQVSEAPERAWDIQTNASRWTDDLEATAARLRDESTTPGGRPLMYDEEHWQQVAGVYRDAAKRGDAPTKAVAEWGQVSKSAAAKWVARCRDLGLLPPTQRGRPNA